MKSRHSLHRQIRNLTMVGMLTAVGILLPALFHTLSMSGQIFLPMHIPVLLAGLFCGPVYGAVCGLILPFLNSVLTGMPPLFPTAVLMTGELAVYGFLSGLLYRCTPLGRYRWGIFPSLLVAMAGGRLLYGVLLQILLTFDDSLKAATVKAAFLTGLPGIVIQLLLIPSVVWAVELSAGQGHKNAVQSAKNLLKEGTAACILIRKNTIVRSESGSGIAPLLRLYDENLLSGTVVVDKIIGKAAAELLVAGHAKACHGIVMSESAVRVLRRHHITLSYDECVPYIVNRKGDGICPMEQAVEAVDDPEAAPDILRRTLASLSETPPSPSDRT